MMELVEVDIVVRFIEREEGTEAGDGPIRRLGPRATSHRTLRRGLVKATNEWELLEQIEDFLEGLED